MARRVMTYTVVALAALVAGCGDEVGGVEASSPSPSVSASADREALLATCPAKAPSWQGPQPRREGIAGEIDERRRYGMRHDEEYVRQLHALHDSGGGEWSESGWNYLMTREEEAGIWSRQEDIQPSIAAVSRYLSQLPKDQVGELRHDWESGGIVVQVTRDAGTVKADLAAQVGSDLVGVETVRYSSQELAALQKKVWDLKVPGVVTASFSVNNRVEFGVHGDVDEARRLIGSVADPCSFTVEYSEPPTIGVGEAE